MNDASAFTFVPDGSTPESPAVRFAVTVPPAGPPSMTLRGAAVMVTDAPGRSPVGPSDTVGASVTQAPDFHRFSAA